VKRYNITNSSEKGERSSIEVNAPRHRSVTFPQLEQAPKEFMLRYIREKYFNKVIRNTCKKWQITS